MTADKYGSNADVIAAVTAASYQRRNEGVGGSGILRKRREQRVLKAGSLQGD